MLGGYQSVNSLNMIFSIPVICLLLTRLQFIVGSGLVEVFGWSQLQFHESEAIDRFQSTNNANSDKIIFPGLSGYRMRREDSKSTSRDAPQTSSRWNLHSPPTSTTTANYIPYSNVPMGVTHFRGRLFITVPRRRIGVPSTLNYIDMQDEGKTPSPKLHAFPNMEINAITENPDPNSNKIISVYRTTVDNCQRLWFIDTGMLEYPDNHMQVQRPSVWIINLVNDKTIRRVDIPQSIVETGQGLASITVDVGTSQCDKAFAYIPDLLNNQLYVYSFEGDNFWSFSHNYFNFDPLAGDLFVGGQNFRWNDGIFSVTLGAPLRNDERIVFFHPMASNNEFIVPNKVLQNSSNADRSSHGQDFQLLGSRGINRQSTMHQYDHRTDVIFYAEIQRNGVGCWNINKKFSPQNHDTIATDPLRMIYPSDLTIDEDGVIWVMTNKLPIYIYSELDPNVVNFRVWKQSVYKAVENTVCQPQ